jgi:hypothetical protein
MRLWPLSVPLVPLQSATALLASDPLASPGTMP